MNPFWTPDEQVANGALLLRTTAPGSEPLLDDALRQWTDQHPYDLALSRWSDPEAWRRTARAFVLESLGWQGPRLAPAQIEVRDVWDADGLHWEELSIPVTPPLRAPATFVRPSGIDGPVPGILALHSMGSYRLHGREKFLPREGEPALLTEYRNTNYEGISVVEALARRGFAVLTIDAMGFGERTRAASLQGDQFLNWRKSLDAKAVEDFQAQAALIDEACMVRQLEAYGRSWAGLIVSDDRCSLDYLASRPEVDDDRLGCVGLSYGAARTNFLAAVDERVRAAASICWMSCLPDIIGYNTRGALGWFLTAHPLFSRLDLPDLACLAAPRAYMAMSGWDDPMLQPTGMVDAHHILRDGFTRMGSAENLGSLILPGGHHFRRDRQEIAFSFLEKFLMLVHHES